MRKRTDLKLGIEQDSASLVVDTRRLSHKFDDFVKGDAISFVIFGLGVASFLLKSYVEVIGIGLVLLYLYVKGVRKRSGLVMVMPKSSGDIDPGNLDQKGNPKPAEGIVYWGKDKVSGEEVWQTDTQARTHVLVMGTTGSGKTELLLSLVYNALIHGSGFIYVDGKADNSSYGKVYSMARAMGREDDVLVINFQTGGRDIYGAQSSKLSNTLNPFSNGSSGMLSELVKGLMQTGEKSTWTQQAESFVEALIKPLVFLRDKYGLDLDVNVVRDYFDINKLEEMAWRLPDQYPGLEESGVLDGIRAYLKNKPGYKQEKYHDQSDTVHEQHGYITMQLGRTFNSLSDTYGYIMKTPLAEIDFVDVFLNRRILFVMLPSLEKSPTELTNLGRIVVASIKATMAKGLGNIIEGDWDEVIDSKPSTAPSPFMCVLDEYGYYAVEGFAVVPAQARSLGFSAIFAGQDLPAFEKASKEEALSTRANTNTMLCGKLTCTETYKFFQSIAGEGTFTRIQGFERESSGASLIPEHKTSTNVSIEKMSRVSFEALRGQESGEWHFFFANTIVRMKGFYANPKPVKKLRVNHFLRVARPSTEQVSEYSKAFDLFERAVSSEGGLASFMDRVSTPADILAIRTGWETYDGSSKLLLAGKVLAHCALEEERRSQVFTDMSLSSASFDAGDEFQEEGFDAAGLDVRMGQEERLDEDLERQMSESELDAVVANSLSADDHELRAREAAVLGGPNDFEFGFGAADAGRGQPSHAARSDNEGLDVAEEARAALESSRNPRHGHEPSEGHEGAAVESPDDVAGLWSDERQEEHGAGEGMSVEQGAQDVPVVYDETPHRAQLLPRLGDDDAMFNELPPQACVFGNEGDEPGDYSDLELEDSGDVLQLHDDSGHDLEQAAGDVVDDIGGEGAFDAPAASGGLLSRAVTESGVAAIERAAGAPDMESLLTASAVAEALGSATKYPITPPSSVDLNRFKDVASRLKANIAREAEED